jgi:hypothetical protein
MFFRSITTAAVGVVFIPALVAAADANLNFIYASGSFSTISGTTGSETGHSGGFTLTTSDGTQVYSNDNPADHDPCYNTGGGRDFGMTSSCWDGTAKFHCKSNFGGLPKKCSATGTDGTVWTGDSDDSTDFIGIAVSVSGYCGGGLYIDGADSCTSDDTFDIVSI